MVLKAENPQILVKTGVAPTTPLNATNSAASINIPVGQGVEVPTNEDTLSTNTDLTSSESHTLRSENEVNSVLDNIAKKFNLIREDVVTLIQRIANKNFEDLLNMGTNEYTKLTKGIDSILQDCIVNNEIDNTKLEKAINDYNIALQTGWSIDGFRKQQLNVQKSTITERLAETNCFDKETIKPFIEEALNGRDINNLNEKELKEVKRQAIEKYLSTLTTEEYDETMEVALENFFEKLLLSNIDENMPAEERKKIYREQLQTFGRLLVNTENGRDRELLGSAIDKLYRTNIVPAAKAGISAMSTEESKANFAKHIDLKEAVTTDSKYEKNVYMTKDQAEELAFVKYGNMRAEDIKEDLPVMEEEAKIFFEKNKEILAIIDEKLENNIELTKDELAIQRERENLHTSRYSGATAGIANSENSSVIENKKELLTELISDLKEIENKTGHKFYQEVMNEVSNFVKENPTLMTLTETEFTELLDEVTEKVGVTKYSELNNQKSYVNNQEQEVSNDNNNTKTPSQTSIGFEEKNAPIATNISVEELYAQSYKDLISSNTVTESSESAPKNLAEARKKGSIEKIKEFAETQGESYLNVALDLLSNYSNLSANLMTWALARIWGLDNSQIADACNKIKNNDNKMEVGSKITTLEALQKVNCNNGLVAQFFEERIEELKELHQV